MSRSPLQRLQRTPGAFGQDDDFDLFGSSDYDEFREETARTALATVTVEDEDKKERRPYYLRLKEVASSGDFAAAETLLKVMADPAVGLTPGPRAYHGLLCAYTMAGKLNNAVDVLTRAREQGVQPLAESYAVLVRAHILLGADKVDRAQELLQEACEQCEDPRPAWLQFCGTLYEVGAASGDDDVRGATWDVAFNFMSEGFDQGLRPDAWLYGHIIRALVRLQALQQALEMYEEMQADGIFPDKGVLQPLIFGWCANGIVENANRMLTAWEKGNWGNVQRPDVDTYNAIIAGVARGAEIPEENSYEPLYLLDEEALSEPTLDPHRAFQDFMLWRMHQNGVIPNQRTYALCFEMFLAQRHLVWAYQNLVLMISETDEAPGPHGATWLLEPYLLHRFIWLARLKWNPHYMAYALRLMVLDGRLLDRRLKSAEHSGRTICTSWLAECYTQIRQANNLPVGGLLDKNWENEAVEEVEGVLIGLGRCAVDEEGAVIPPSRLGLKEMHAELVARGLPEGGKRRDMYKRIQAARRSMPIDIVREARMRYMKKTSRAFKLREKRAREEQELLDEFEDQELLDEDDEEDFEEDESEDEDDASVPRAARRRGRPRRARSDDDDLDPDEDLDLFDEDDGAEGLLLEPASVDRQLFLDVPGDDIWAYPSIAEESEMFGFDGIVEYGSNSSVDALRIIDSFERLGGKMSPCDIHCLIKVSEIESIDETPEVAYFAATRWHEGYPRYVESEIQEGYEITIKTCLEGGRPDLAGSISFLMLEHGYAAPNEQLELIIADLKELLADPPEAILLDARSRGVEVDPKKLEEERALGMLAALMDLDGQPRPDRLPELVLR